MLQRTGSLAPTDSCSHAPPDSGSHAPPDSGSHALRGNPISVSVLLIKPPHLNEISARPPDWQGSLTTDHDNTRIAFDVTRSREGDLR